MPGTVAHVQEALDRVRDFITDPDPVGVYLHLAQPGVDLTLHAIGQRVGAYAWRCAPCDHLAKRGSPPSPLGDTTCPACEAPAPRDIPFHGELTYRTYAWSLRWPQEGKPGWGRGRIIDEGRFTDATLASGFDRIQTCLERDLPLLERQGLVSMKDLNTLMRMGPQRYVDVQVNRM